MESMNETLHQMWDTRPVRLPREQGSEAKFLGVCEGIGVRYQIDPTLVRIFFVLFAFFGGGFLLYLIAWLIMPKYSLVKAPVDLTLHQDDSVKNSKILRSERNTGWILILVIFLIIFSSSSSGTAFFRTGYFTSFIVFFLAWYLLHQRTPEPPVGLLQRHPDSSGPQVDLSAYSPIEGFDAPLAAPQPPAWDPLGTAPFAWDLPEPGPAPQQKKPRNPLIRGLAWFAGGLVIVGIIIAAMAGAPERIDDSFGDIDAQPTNAAQLADSYILRAGDIDLDLSRMAALDKPRHVRVQTKIGDVHVRLPQNIRVQVSCGTRIGDKRCSEGLHNPDAQGETLNLRVTSGVGDVTVQ
ncbi:PspC domain-containing protein [Corynebacterium pseudotuberculosis]|uniref:PspC domain-containing protein n=1 Tax=Corynebacterium pseudotuberculosis TaxID=1719 RepID=UPI00065E6233|nr:PspC domain-containing protein [Corynebacterium pseudotuberculosis]